jgi:Xaa-Pro aminopeptidase
MAEIYDAVLAAQLAGIAETRPGKTLADIDKACKRVLAERGFVASKYMPHGTSHYVGLEVHDVGTGGKPFVPGVAFTIEPGVYDAATGIVVRIEDVVVVTETGCEVITDGVTKDRVALSRLQAEEGILDRWPVAEVLRALPSASVTNPR